MSPETEVMVLRKRLRDVAIGKIPAVDASHINDGRSSREFYEGGCRLSPGEMAVLYRMQQEGTL